MSAEQIVTRFKELEHEIALPEVEERLSTLMTKFKVPEDDANSSVVAYYLRHFVVDRADYYKGAGANQSVSISDIPNEEDKWVNLRVKFVDLWDNAHELMQQVGLVGDSTGKIKFTIWKSAGLESMEVDKSYSIENVVTKVWNDRVSITMNKTSVITEIDDDIEVGFAESEMVGAMVTLKTNSGLIKRCPTCKRALKSGTCPEHGNVDGYYDLRIMAVIDDGVIAQDVLLGKELTESVWGRTMDEAMGMATQALDSGAVMDDMANSLVGKYYSVKGSMMESMLLVKTCEAV